MKRKLLRNIIILLIMSFIISACSRTGRDQNTDNTDEKLIVTSFYPIYLLTANITKDIKGVRVVNMTEPQTGCLHDYQLVPADLRALEKAEIFVINGAGMESFLDEVLKQYPELTVIEASKNIPLLKDSNGEDNPHVWVSVSGTIAEVKNITKELIEADPYHAEAYGKNSQSYIEALERLRSEMKEGLKDIKIRDIVTFHEAFPYFAQEFDLNIVAVVEQEPDSVPVFGEREKIIEEMKRLDTKVIFTEPQYSQKVAESIASQTGAKVYNLDPIVTGPKNAPLDSYEKTMKENLQVLIEALK